MMFDVTPAAPRPVPVAPARERDILDLLAQRYTRVGSSGAHRYAFAEHVPNRPGFADRIADFVAVDCYLTRDGGWRQPAHYEVHGHEVKVSRTDWLAELRRPEKAQAFTPFMDRWWLVVSDSKIVRAGELPETWGLMVRAGSVLRAVKPAPKLDPEPMPRPMLAALTRAVARTAFRAATGVPVNEQEPTEPAACSNCGASWEECAQRVFGREGKACCRDCHRYVTHDQDAPEHVGYVSVAKPRYRAAAPVPDPAQDDAE